MGEGSLHPHPEGWGIRDPPHSLCIKLCKLMGDAKRDSPEESPVLTRSEYIKRSNSREKMLEILSNYIHDGSVLYIGYSFKDKIIFQLIDELRDNCSCKIDTSYALIPGMEHGSKMDRLLSKKNIIPIPITFEEFAEQLDKKIAISKKDAPRADYISLNLKYKELKISYRDYKEYADHFQIMNQNMINVDFETGSSESERIEKFLKGQSDSWEPFIKSWDFRRDTYFEIRDKIKQELSKTRPEDNDILLILGGGGLGKSVMLKRLAYDFYKDRTPVLILNNYQTYFDIKLMNKFCEEMNSGLNLTDQKHKVIIIMDNADMNIDTLKNIRISLKNNSKSALIIGASRINEWECSVRQWGLTKVVREENIIELPQKMGNDELQRLIEHIARLLNHEELSTDIDYWISKAIEDYESDFFAVIYGLVDPARRKLNEILWDEYVKLPSDTTKRAYEYVCLFYKYGIPLKLELIVNALVKKFDYSYNQFEDDILNTEAKSIMIAIQDDIHEDLLFRAKNKIIAQKIVERLFDAHDSALTEKMVQRYEEVLSEIKALDITGINIAKSLLITYLGPNGFEKGTIGNYHLSRLFESLLANGIDDSKLLHHYGILSSRGGDFIKAEKLLIKSLEIAKMQFDGGDSEEEGMIMNSLGVLYSEEGIKHLSHDEEKAIRLFEKAGHYFEISKKKHPRSPHPYHSMAYSAMKRGERHEAKGQEEEKFKWYSKALETIGEAKESLTEDEMEWILTLESEMYTRHFDNFKKAKDNLIDFINRYPKNLSGYILISKILYKKAKEYPIGSDNNKVLCQDALFYVKEGLEIFPKNQDLLKTKYYIIKNICPEETNYIYKILLARYLAAEGNCLDLNLLFDLGTISFELGHYKLSRDIFRELDGKSRGHYKSSGIIDVAKNSDNSRKVFKGYILELIPPKMGYVRSDEIRYPIKFSILTQKRELRQKQEVEFNIAFNYRGAFAIDLKPN
jgi:hypothetical protein